MAGDGGACLIEGFAAVQAFEEADIHMKFLGQEFVWSGVPLEAFLSHPLSSA